MHSTPGSRLMLVALALGGVLMGGCSGVTTGGASTTGGSGVSEAGSAAAGDGVPDAATLADRLLTPADLTGEWTVDLGPAGAVVDGLVDDAQAAKLPQLQLCGAATEQSRQAVRSLRWQAFRQLSEQVPDPLESGRADASGRTVFVQDYLLAMEPADTAATFVLIRDGLRACLGTQPDDAAGYTGTSEELALPDVGDERYGQLDTVVGPDGSNRTWYQRQALVRTGPVLVMTSIVELTVGADVAPQLTAEASDAIVTAAVSAAAGG